ncbi:MAG: hypothetical protein QN183_13095 [Armatimonadota bacterium]|nr:hypothetical protein [Armatimonadota bacterium]MDR7537286.1 hypothetical protein [Armatimonadota bacterium]
MSLGPYQARVADRLRRWDEIEVPRRLWARDPTLWASSPLPELANRLGWLALPFAPSTLVDALEALARQVRDEGVRDVLLLGMGGSSLAPEVCARTLTPASGAPALTVLDTTHPAAIRATAARLEPAHTLVLVSSKSGTTTETLALFRYFWDWSRAGGGAPGRRFIAMTDPQTPLARLAAARRFRCTVTAPPDVGGRYSALSVFGLVPAALMGADVRGLLAGAREFAEAIGPGVPCADNPALALGAALGELALAGRDKVTFLASPEVAALPVWVEQLLAESTGKDGRGLVPVVDEPWLDAGGYGTDRVFVVIGLAGATDTLEARAEALASAGHPVVRIGLDRVTQLGQEFLRWEVATAAAGMVLGIHPFTQPDVQLAKDLAARAMAHGASADEVQEIAAEHAAAPEVLEAWLSGLREGEYVALLAFLAPGPKTWASLQEIRELLARRYRVATTAGFGPRFLHSTGQLHKGGPNTGRFLQLVDQPADDVPVPGGRYSFGTLIQAQAAGDYQALVQRGRRVLRLGLGRDAAAGLAQLLAGLRRRLG